MALRGGFRVPNAATFAPDFQTAQPDQGDFLILGNAQYGVIKDCEVTLVGHVVSIGAGPHLLVLNGTPYFIGANQQKTLSNVGTSGPRFDLVVFDLTAGFSVITGVGSTTNPVYPDVTDSMVVLAAAYINADDTVRLIDKRSFLQTSAIGYDATTLVRNYTTGSSAKFDLDGNGKLTWNDGDTALERLSNGKVKITSSLQVANLEVTSGGTIQSYRIVTEDDIAWGKLVDRPGSGRIGQIWVDEDTGDPTVYKKDSDGVPKWLSVGGSLPSGSVIQSLLEPDRMPGFLPLTGNLVAKADVGGLWDLFPSWQRPSNLFQLPDMRGRFPVGAGNSINYSGGAPGTTYGSPLKAGGGMDVTVQIANMPSHDHGASGATTTNAGGAHTHSGTTNGAGGHTHSTSGSGDHSHSISDGGHQHFADPYGVPIIGAEWDGRIDTQPQGMIEPWYNGAPTSWIWVKRGSNITSKNATGLSVSGGSHSHLLSSASDHTHTFTTASGGDHTHAISGLAAQGWGTPLTVQPPSMGIYFYIKI